MPESTVFLFLTGFLLLTIGWVVRKQYGLAALVVCVGIVFVFVAGEEINWGERLFGYAIPDFMRGLYQDKTPRVNFHNVSPTIGRFFRFGIEASILLLYIATAASFFAKKRTFVGVPLPTLLIMFCFFLAESYWVYPTWGLLTILTKLKFATSAIVLFLLYAILTKNGRLLYASAMTFALMLSTVLVNSFLTHGLPDPAEEVSEIREYLFSLACFLYACELFTATAFRERGRPLL